MKTKLGEIIKRERENKNMSKRKLGYLIGISDTEIGRIEDGERIHPNINIFVKICNVLDLDINDVLKEAGYFNDSNKYTFSIKRISNNAIEIKSNNLIKVLELMTKLSFDIDEIIPDSDDEIELEITDNNKNFDPYLELYVNE